MNATVQTQPIITLNQLPTNGHSIIDTIAEKCARQVRISEYDLEEFNKGSKDAAAYFAYLLTNGLKSMLAKGILAEEAQHSVIKLWHESCGAVLLEAETRRHEMSESYQIGHDVTLGTFFECDSATPMVLMYFQCKDIAWPAPRLRQALH